MKNSTSRSLAPLRAITFGGLALFTAGNTHAQAYTIPVVVHVLYTNPINNISDAQVMDGLNVLNQGFNSVSPDLFPPFDTLAANMGVEFCLASIDPDGNPTNGIDRIETPWSQHGGQPESYMDQWPRDRYMNIWVVANVDNDVFTQAAYRPEQVDTDPLRDGIMLLNSFMGSIGTGDPFAARSILNSGGRYLGLKLLWEDPINGGPCGDDEVADTPPCEMITDCSDPLALSCEPGVPENIQNCMTYSYCYRMFTFGQKARVLAALNSPVAQRNNLWTASNLALSGCATSGIGEPDRPVKLLASPNPFLDRITLSGLPHGTVVVELLDLSGRCVGRWETGPQQSRMLEIHTGDLASGTYLLRATGVFGQAGSLVQKE